MLNLCILSLLNRQYKGKVYKWAFDAKYMKTQYPRKVYRIEDLREEFWPIGRYFGNFTARTLRATLIQNGGIIDPSGGRTRRIIVGEGNRKANIEAILALIGTDADINIEGEGDYAVTARDHYEANRAMAQDALRIKAYERGQHEQKA